MSWGTEPVSSSAGADLVYEVDSSLLLDALTQAVRAGWLVSLSASRDGGALSVATIADGERTRVWCADKEELERALTALQKAATG